MSEKVKKFLLNLNRKKLLSRDMQRPGLERCLGLTDLTFLGISAMMGSGLYVLAGAVTRHITGPSIVISYVFAAIATALSAICYAEFAARMPVAGSAYQFAYISIGEFWAFQIGWCIVLEYTIYAAATAKTCSSYLDGLFGNVIRNYMLKHLPMLGKFVASYPDLLGAGLIVLFTIIVISGVKFSSKLNIVITSINGVAITFIIITGFYLADWNNWFHVKGTFFPFGWSGTISGATTLVYSYIGYDVVASATEEAKNPARDIPLGLLLSISFVVVSFVGASAALTVMVPWYKVSVTTPFPSAYRNHGWMWANYVVSIGALAAMVTCLLSLLYVVPRYLLAMSRDGLLWKFLSILHSKNKVPWPATLVAATISIMMTIIFNLTALVEFISIGQLMACIFVATCVIKLRYCPNEIVSFSLSNPGGIENIESTDLTESTSSSGLELKLEKEEKTEKTPLRETDGNEIGESSFSYNTMEDETKGNDMTSPLLEKPSSAGCIKQQVLDSRFGYMFNWTVDYEPGDLPFRSLLVAVLCAAIAVALLLFAGKYSARWWFILIVCFLAFTALMGVCFITLFNQDSSIKTFKVPLVPFIPFISIVINIALVMKLQVLTWIRFAIWLAVGLVAYFGYGYRHSEVREENNTEE